jgi:hypothetical protein
MIRFAEVRIDEERRFAFYEDGDGVIVNAGFLRFDEAEHWAAWDQFEADYETTRSILGDSTGINDLASYRRLCPDWVL